eukprot:7372111-Ditylum_brightwellii.AAC.1
MLNEFLDVFVHLEEAELQKLLGKKIVCARKEHDDNGKGKHQDKPKSRHKRSHSSGKRHQGKNKCNFVQACRKNIQPMHHIMEQQRLWQVWFVKDAKRWPKSAA